MALAQRTGRSRHRLILLALTAITLLTVDLNSFGPADTAQRVVRDAVHPVASLASTVVSPIGDAWNSVFNYGDLEAENDALQAELDALRGSVIRGEADSATLRRLLEASELPFRDDIETVVADVVRGAVGNFDDHVITINKGGRHGIEEGMAVVTGAGMVGRVERVDNATATVQLLSDPSLFIGVRLVSTGDVGLGHAVPGDESRFLVDRGTNLPDTGDPSLLPAIGSAVVTDGRSRYPADVPIGSVIAVEPGSDNVTMEVTVELSNDVEDLHFVSVMLTREPDTFPLEPVVPENDVGAGIDPALLNPDPEAEEGEG